MSGLKVTFVDTTPDYVASLKDKVDGKIDADLSIFKRGLMKISPRGGASLVLDIWEIGLYSSATLIHE